MRLTIRATIFAFTAALTLAAPAAAQIPDKFTNLKFLPQDIKRDSLVGIMRGFSFALGVRCQYCHVGGDGVSFAGVEFAKDDDPDKLKARWMLRMVDSLNRFVLPQLPGAGANLVKIECKTCHRGINKPLLLSQRLEQIRADSGIDAAIAKYRQLRTSDGMSGRYDFGEWEMNVWGERLVAAGKPAEAIKVYQLNLEFFPQSTSILGTLGRLHEPTDKAKAIEYFEKVLLIAPNDARLRQHVDSLKAAKTP